MTILLALATAWLLLAIPAAVVIGKAIKLADRRDGAHGTAELPARRAA